MGQRAAKKWERRAGPQWRAERLRTRQHKRLQQAQAFLKAFYADSVPIILDDLRRYGAARERMFGVAS